MILGFTGTRVGMTEAQRKTLASVISTLPARVLHGGAVGSDEEFDTWLISKGMLSTDIEVYPASVGRHTHWTLKNRIVQPVSDPLTRNWVIVRRIEHLLATPETAEMTLRSGTWATVRYARKQGRPITIIRPDGMVREERS